MRTPTSIIASRLGSLNRKAVTSLFVHCSLILSSCLLCLAAPWPSLADESAVDAALRAGDWVRLRTTIHELTPADSVVAGLLEGHACLASNLNNESLCLFQAYSSDEAHLAWLDWARHFSRQHPHLATAQYLLGDALARSRQWSAALAALDLADSLSPRDAMILNARGAVRCGAGHWDRALADFDAAIAANTAFADAAASFGTFWVLQRTGPQEALRFYTKALAINSDFALALNGRACAHYALGDWDDSEADLAAALGLGLCSPQALLNQQALLNVKLEHLASRADRLAAAAPGMDIQRRIQDTQRQLKITQMRLHGTNVVQHALGDILSQSRFNVDLRMGRGGASARAGLAVDLSQTGQEWMRMARDNMNRNAQRTVQLQNHLSDLLRQNHTMPSGVTAEDLRWATVDTGDWPVDSFFGLFYMVEPIDARGATDEVSP